jgi:hypothetical protein
MVESANKSQKSKIRFNVGECKMTLQGFRERAKWFGLVSGLFFLCISFYLSLDPHYNSYARETMAFLWSAIVLALLTLIFGLFSIPRWQSLVSLAVFGYSVYWFFTAAISSVE